MIAAGFLVIILYYTDVLPHDPLRVVLIATGAWIISEGFRSGRNR